MSVITVPRKSSLKNAPNCAKKSPEGKNVYLIGSLSEVGRSPLEEGMCVEVAGERLEAAGERLVAVGASERFLGLAYFDGFDCCPQKRGQRLRERVIVSHNL